MKRFLLALLVSLLLFIIPAVHAQDLATPDTSTAAPPPVVVTAEAPDTGGDITINMQAPAASDPAPVVSDNSLIHILFTVIILALLATVAVVGPKLVNAAAESAPSWMVDALITAINSLLDNAAAYAETTPPEYDDEAVAELRAKVLALEEQIKAGRGSVAATTVNVNPPPPDMILPPGGANAS